MPLQFTLNPTRTISLSATDRTASLRIAGNATARFASIVALDWASLVNVPVELENIGDLATTGLITRTDSDGAIAARTLQAPAAGLTITNPAGIAGDPTFALADDLSALEALSGTDTLYYRSGVSTWSAVTIGGLLSFSGGTLNVGDAELTAIAGLASAADKAPYFTGSGTAALADFTSYGRSIVAVANEAAFKSLVNLEIGTDVQAYDADLDAIAGLAKTDGNIIVGNGTTWVAESGATARTSLGLGTGDSPQFTNETLTGYVYLTEIVAPSSPSANVARFYAKDNGSGTTKVYFKDSAGTETEMGAAGAQAKRENGLTPHEALTVNYVSATTVDIDADAVVLFDSSDIAKRFTTLNETLDITVSGTNGLDTGFEASDTWYYVWAIGKTDGTLDGLLSASATAPTLPSGYTFKGLLGAVRNNASSNFVAFFQRDNEVALANVTLVSLGTATTYTSIDMSAAVPPNAKTVDLNTAYSTSSGTADVIVFVAPAGLGSSFTYNQIAVSSPAQSTTASRQNLGRFVLSTPQQVVYRLSGTNAQANIIVYGYTY